MEGRLDTTEKIIKYMAGPIYDRCKNAWLNEGITLGRNEGIALGRNEGITLGSNEGITLGRNEGISEGQMQLNMLYSWLARDNRTDELLQAIDDPELRQKLFWEYQNQP